MKNSLDDIRYCEANNDLIQIEKALDHLLYHRSDCTCDPVVVLHSALATVGRVKGFVSDVTIKRKVV